MCYSNWIYPNLEGLHDDLDRNVFGQPFVKLALLPTLTSHVSRSHPNKALSLSFHGNQGTGKNYVTEFIIKNLYRFGSKSSYVHYFNGKTLFRHKEYLELYKSDLYSWLQGNISACPQSLFVFDEVDKMLPGLFDVIKPFLDYQQFIKNTDSRKSIFIFLSNIGGAEIKAKTLELLNSGIKRESFNLSTFQNILRELANTKGGFEDSALLGSHLIDLFIPFLPLEETHVEECIRRILKEEGLLGSNVKTIVRKVLADLDIEPHGKVQISASGCRHLIAPIAIYSQPRRTEL